MREGVVKACPICGTEDAKSIKRRDHRPVLFRCRKCGAVFLGSVWGANQVSEYYRGYYKTRAIEYDPLTENRYHAILDRLEQLRPVGRLLDVGCGTGHFLSVAEARGWQAVGLEVSKSALEFLERIRTERGFKFSVVGGDLVQAGFPFKSFDAVTLFEVIEHLNDPVATLREVHRVLKDDGILYLTTPNFDSLPRYILGQRWRVIAEEHLCLFNPKTLRDCLVTIGFRPLKVLTKNVDVPEILSKSWRRGELEKNGTPISNTRSFRETVESSLWLRWLKAGANTALRLLQLGETLEALAVKDKMPAGGGFSPSGS